MSRHRHAFRTLLFLLLPACGDDTTTTPLVPRGSGETVTVRTAGTTFQPADITIVAGTTVIWSDTDLIAHTVTSGQDSRAVDAGRMFDLALADHATVQFTFQSAGTFPYFCRLHELMNMRGAVTVTRP